MSAAHVLAALSTSAAVDDRWVLVREILDLMHHERFPINQRYPSLIALCEACYRSESHAGAFAALSADSRLSLLDWKSAIGMLARIRFRADSFMSSSQFSEFLQLYEARGGVVDGELFIAYIKGLSMTISFLRHPEELRIVSQRDRPRRLIFNHIRMSAHALERDILPRYPAVERGSIAVSLLRLYLHLPRIEADIQRVWDAISASPPRVRAEAVSTLEMYPLDAVAALWEDHLTSEADPQLVNWAAFERALRKGGAYAGQVTALVDRIPDYPEVRAVMAPAAPDVGDLERAAEALLEHTTLPAPRVARIIRYVQRAERRVAFLIPLSEWLADTPTFLRDAVFRAVAARRAGRV
ncbi:hypothetical protein AURDEDRAFT_184027 [Auricularia subglabra TFB-10046 SS5]|nr:hypothetical protein AURDEDRAFT_184027 [Auricularia subglabra TFB-10046 SS5]